jgi:LuxR family transcriptional regulator, maltose regulon positive regulatory protein
VLVLDDYYRASSAATDSAVTFLAGRLPENLRLIVATREEPGFPLAHWRSLERMVEIGMQDLRFSYDEATVFWKETMEGDIDPSSVRVLETRTDGWIVGLQLAALSVRLRGRDEMKIEAAAGGFSGRHRFLVDYLASEVMRRQSGDMRAFLRQSAILERPCAPLSDTLTGRTDSTDVLVQLERGNMFLTRLDEERQWYRYHELFVDFLRASLHVTEEQALPSTCCKRCPSAPWASIPAPRSGWRTRFRWQHREATAAYSSTRARL